MNSPTVGFRFLTFCCFVLFNAEIAFAGIVDFEGLAPGLVPNGYQGLDTWNNFAVISPSSSPDSGYPNAIISGLNVGYNGAGDDASILNSSTFSLKSGYFTAAWNDNLSLNVVGYKGNIPLFNNTYSLSSTSPLLINFDYDEIDKVVFHSGGGSHNPG